jgi:hypothetical protein
MEDKRQKPKKVRKPREKVQKQQPVIRLIPIDTNNDNFVRIKSTDKTIIITLILEGDKPRLIGTVTKSTKTIRMKRKRSIHLFKKYNAYGFNDYILREAKQFDKIRLSDEYADWKIPVKYILENGKYLNFKQQGFELQRFVTLDELEQFRIKPTENRRF